MTSEKIKVWDMFIRIFHWSLVFSFAVAFFTEDDYLTIHTYAGYAIATLVSLRLIWGVIGGHYAQFKNFIDSPRNTISYISTVIHFKAKRHIGHNPAGGAMVLLLLVSLILTILFGMLTYGVAEYSGPFSYFATQVTHKTAHIFKETHEFLANFTMILVLIHIVGVAIASYQHQENLIKCMVTGYKKPKPTK